MLLCFCNVLVLMKRSGVDALFGNCCKVQIFMHCSVVDATFGCLCNDWVLMQCLGVVAFLVLMQHLGVYVMSMC